MDSDQYSWYYFNDNVRMMSCYFHWNKINAFKKRGKHDQIRDIWKLIFWTQGLPWPEALRQLNFNFLPFVKLASFSTLAISPIISYKNLFIRRQTVFGRWIDLRTVWLAGRNNSLAAQIMISFECLRCKHSFDLTRNIPFSLAAILCWSF